jgi:predicted NUDIX family NTP pyrophosphohydrolase
VDTKVTKNQSAGLLLYRRSQDVLELLGHPGGPFWKNKDDGAWSVPKGLIAPGETPLVAAKREFAEETGHKPRGKSTSLGTAKQPGGKIVHVWAVEGRFDPSTLRSNMFEMGWPPRSGRMQSFPELDRADWFIVPTAMRKILKGQAVFLKRFSQAIGIEAL